MDIKETLHKIVQIAPDPQTADTQYPLLVTEVPFSVCSVQLRLCFITKGHCTRGHGRDRISTKSGRVILKMVGTINIGGTKKLLLAGALLFVLGLTAEAQNSSGQLT